MINDKPSELDAFLDLPSDPQGQKPVDDGHGDKSDDNKPANPAADLIRQKVEAAYGVEPDAKTELSEAGTIPAAQRSRHQKFIYELTSSGKSLAEIQMAWHDYYAGLPDEQKHAVWQEFYATQAAEAHHPLVEKISSMSHEASRPGMSSVSVPDIPQTIKKATQSLSEFKDHLLSAQPKAKTPRARSPMRSLVFGLSMGAIAVLVVLFSFFNERFIAPFIQPSRSLSNVPLISDTPVGKDPEIIIPKINVEIPVVYDIKTIDEAAVDKALERGVVHYADTALPGQDGNVVIVGHSSNNIFNRGKYKFAFVLLKRMEPGDTFYLQKDGKRYTYEIYQKKIIDPSDVSVLGTADKPATATLITCDPPGTSLHRLVITAEQVSPSPSHNAPKASDNKIATESKIVPGNSQSLWSRFWGWISH